MVDDSLHFRLAGDELDTLSGEGNGRLENALALVRVGEEAQHLLSRPDGEAHQGLNHHVVGEADERPEHLGLFSHPLVRPGTLNLLQLCGSHGLGLSRAPRQEGEAALVPELLLH